MKKALLHIAICAILQITAYSVLLAQKTHVQATLDTATIRIGEVAKLYLSVDYRLDQGSVEIQWPAIADTLTRAIEVLEVTPIDTMLANPEEDPYAFRQWQEIQLTSFDSGFWAIPPFAFLINGETATTEALLLSVQTIAVDTAEGFKDIKEIIEVPFDLLEWLQSNWPIVTGSLALLGLAILFLVWWRKRKTKPQPVVANAKPAIPAHVIALEALDKLEREKLWQSGKYKTYYVRLSNVMRGYVENRFSVRAMEKTTDEIMAHLRFKAITEQDKQVLRELLSLSDMVKFAKEQPLASDNERNMVEAKNWINNTRERNTDIGKEE